MKNYELWLKNVYLAKSWKYEEPLDDDDIEDEEPADDAELEVLRDTVAGLRARVKSLASSGTPVRDLALAVRLIDNAESVFDGKPTAADVGDAIAVLDQVPDLLDALGGSQVDGPTGAALEPVEPLARPDRPEPEAEDPEAAWARIEAQLAQLTANYQADEPDPFDDPETPDVADLQWLNSLAPLQPIAQEVKPRPATPNVAAFTDFDQIDEWAKSLQFDPNLFEPKAQPEKVEEISSDFDVDEWMKSLQFDMPIVPHQKTPEARDEPTGEFDSGDLVLAELMESMRDADRRLQELADERLRKQEAEARVMQDLSKLRRLVSSDDIGKVLDDPAALAELASAEPPTAEDRIKYFSHLHSLEGEERVEGEAKPTRLEGWRSEKFLPLRVGSLASLAKTMTGTEREALIKEIARTCTAAEIRSECAKVAAFRDQDKLDACDRIAGGIVQRMNELPEGETLVVPMSVSGRKEDPDDDAMGHQVYMNISRKKGGKLTARIDNLGLQVDERADEHASDADGNMYPVIVDDIDPLELDTAKLTSYFSECVRYQASVATPKTSLHHGKDYQDKQRGLRDVYTLDVFTKGGGKMLDPGEMDGCGIKPNKPQFVGNCVVKNASAGMRERLGEELYAKVRAHELDSVARALPEVQLQSLKEKLSQKRVKRIASTFDEVAAGKKGEDQVAAQIMARLKKRTADQRNEMLNPPDGKPLLCSALTTSNQAEESQQATRGLPRVALVLMKMGADPDKAARWMLDNEPDEVGDLQKSLAGLVTPDSDLTAKIVKVLMAIDEEIVNRLLDRRERRLASIRKAYAAALALEPQGRKSLETMYAQVESAKASKAGLEAALRTLDELETRVEKAVLQGDAEASGESSPEAAEALRAYWEEVLPTYQGAIADALSLNTKEASTIQGLQEKALSDAMPEGNLLLAVRTIAECHALARKVSLREQAIDDLSGAVEALNIGRAISCVGPLSAADDLLNIMTLWLGVMRAQVGKAGVQSALDPLSTAIQSFTTDEERVPKVLARLLEKLRATST